MHHVCNELDNLVSLLGLSGYMRAGYVQKQVSSVDPKEPVILSAAIGLTCMGTSLQPGKGTQGTAYHL